MKKILAILMVLCLSAGILAGCGSSANAPASSGGNSGASSDAVSGTKKTFVFGDNTFNASNEEPTINPHEAYSGWPCIRYGVGETLMKIADDGTLEPWLAESATNVNETTWEIVIKDSVCFSNGRKCDAAAVKACLEHLIEVHERAADNLKIASIEADGQKLTIVTSQPNPVLMNYISEPYGCIIDMDEGITDDGIVVGTGPFVATELVTDDHLNLVKNTNYWDGEVHIDEVTIRNITDGDTLALALQSGEIDAAYGMAYGSYPMFENDSFKFSGIQTSRCFWGMVNFSTENPSAAIMLDPAVRKAIALGINKQGFVDVLLNGYGYTATGAFPETFAFGQGVKAESYDPEQAKAVLQEAGWVDTDGDGIREKDGVKLVVRWLTYPSRAELPLLAESAQASLKDIGIDVDINCTANRREFLADMSSFDIYASALVTAPSGDPQYFFTTSCVPGMSYNFGAYENPKVDELLHELSTEFDTAKRAQLAIELQQTILDDNGYVFCSFLEMSMISRSYVSNWTAHACDYYEVTVDLDINK